MMIRERNTGCSFYGQDSGGFVPFFSSKLLISKGISLFIQGHVEGGSQGTQYLITSLGLGDILEEGIQGIILMGGRGQMGGGGDDPGMGSLGWFRVVVPTTCWVILIVTRMILSRTGFLMAYETAVVAHVASLLNWG